MVSNLKVLSSLALLKTLSIKAIKQIFCLKKEEFSAKIGIEPSPPEESFGERDSNFPISPALKAKSRSER